MTYEFFGEMRPRQHQVKTIKFMLANKRGYLFLPIGSGKTASSLWFTDMLLEAGHISKVLIITPLSTMRVVWADEIGKVCPYRKYVVAHGPRPIREQAFKSKAHYYITNTDAVRNFEREINDLNPDVIIIDEVTSFANHSSERSKSMQRIAARAKSVFGLSGNPLSGGLMNSYGLAKVINPSALPNKFMTRYRNMIMMQVDMYTYVPKPGAMEIVQKVLQPAIKFDIEECIDLPPISFETRYSELPKETMALFKQMAKEQVAEYKEGIVTAETAGVKSIRLIQILTGFTKTIDGVIHRTDIRPKMQDLLSLYFEAREKLIVFAQSVETVKLIQEFFLSKKIKCDLIYGDVNPSKRDRAINDFQSLETGVLVAQVRTMSHGITLTKSNTIAFFGPISGAETYEQAIGRIRRSGQTRPQLVVKMVSTKFEEKVFHNLEEGVNLNKAVLEMYNEGLSSFV